MKQARGQAAEWGPDEDDDDDDVRQPPPPPPSRGAALPAVPVLPASVAEVLAKKVQAAPPKKGGYFSDEEGSD